MRFVSLCILSFFVCLTTQAQSIVLDESYKDWETVPLLYSDPSGDGSPIDFTFLKAHNDDRFLYLHFDVSTELNIQRDNNLTIYIDTDHNSNTGQSAHGIGYELRYNFGQKSGTAYSTSIGPYDLGLIVSPTVTSNQFELLMDINTEINNQLLFASDSISIVIVDESNNDMLPNAGEILTYVLNNETTFTPDSYSLNKKTDTDLRVLSYNVERDNLFSSGSEDAFRRIFQAIKPDIIGFQEIYNNSAAQTAALIESFLPSEDGEQWYSAGVGNDNLIVARYPIIKQDNISSNAAYTLDLGDSELFMIVAHPPCCNNDSGRQAEFDEMMSFLRDSQNGSEMALSANTPIIIVGDMNMVGFERQRVTLLEGDISNEQQFGADFSPDWDGSALEDAKPFTPEFPATFTWYSESSAFGAGRLDYIVYSGSVLENVRSYSLFTPALSADSLNAYGLQASDATRASDHLPLVADFRLKAQTNIEESSSQPSNFRLFQNYPNPFNPSTQIRFQLSEPANVELSVFSVSGRKLATLIHNQAYSTGIHQVSFNAAHLSSGVYFYQLEINQSRQIRKMMLIK